MIIEAEAILLLEHWQPSVEGSRDDRCEVRPAASGCLAMNHRPPMTHHKPVIPLFPDHLNARGRFLIIAGIPGTPMVSYTSSPSPKA